MYNEYISHPEHDRVEATGWEVMTDQVSRKKGLCQVNRTPKGWSVQYIEIHKHLTHNWKWKNRSKTLVKRKLSNSLRNHREEVGRGKGRRCLHRGIRRMKRK